MVLVFHAMATNGSRFSHSAPLHVDLDGRAELPLERHKRCALRVLLPTSILSPLHTWHKRLLKAERLYCGIELRLKDLVDLHNTYIVLDVKVRSGPQGEADAHFNLLFS